MFNMNIKNNEDKRKAKRKNGIYKARIIVFLCILGMMLLTGYRAYTLNEQLDSTNSDSIVLEKNIERYSESMLKSMIISNSKLAHFSNKLNSDRLQDELIKEYGVDKIFDVLVRHNYDPEVYESLYEYMNRYFKSQNLTYGNMLLMGTDEGVFFLESSCYREKFNSVKNDKEMITWEEFYKAMPNSKVVKETCEGMKKKRFDSEPVIMRLDGKYIDNRMYKPEDLAKIYKEKGVKGLQGFGFFSLATITDTGDMFGNKDNNFMLENKDVHKIYVFRYTDINQFIGEPIKELTENNIDATVDINKVDNNRKKDISTTTTLLAFNIVEIIALMIVFKSLDYYDEDEIKNDNDDIE